MYYFHQSDYARLHQTLISLSVTGKIPSTDFQPLFLFSQPVCKKLNFLVQQLIFRFVLPEAVISALHSPYFFYRKLDIRQLKPFLLYSVARPRYLRGEIAYL